MIERKQIIEYVEALSLVIVDKPFEKDFDTTVLRHSDNSKWFGIIMSIPYHKINIDRDGVVDIINLKSEPEDSFILREIYSGILPAYHMNKYHWISVILDSAVPVSQIYELIFKSYIMTSPKARLKN